MLIILAAVILIVGIVLAFGGRKALKAGRSNGGWVRLILGSLLTVAAALMVWAVFAFYSQPCAQCM
jgi:hypothetical protein